MTKTKTQIKIERRSKTIRIFAKVFLFLAVFSASGVFDLPYQIKQAVAAQCSTVTISTAGTAAIAGGITSTGLLADGGFTLVCNGNAKTVTSIAVTSSSTTGLSNMQLYTDTAASCSTANPTTQLGSTAGTVSSKTTFSSLSLSVGTTAVCVYVKVDVGAAATNGQTVTFSIAANTDVVSSGQTITGAPKSLGTITLNRTLTVANNGMSPISAITVPIPSSGVYTQGVVKMTSSDTQTVTSVGITVNNSTGLSNVKLYTDNTASCSNANPAGTATIFNTGGTGVNFSTNKATISGSVSVTTTTKCFYIVMDVSTAASDGQALTLTVNASTDVAVSAGVKAGTFPVTASPNSPGTVLNRSISVTANGTSTSTMTIPSTSNYSGGNFQFVRSDGTANVTSIRFLFAGTANTAAHTALSNFTVKYSSTCQTTGIPGGASTFGTGTIMIGATDEVTVTNAGVAVGTTPVCFYVQFDVTNSASNSSTIGVTIDAPSTDILVSSGAVSTLAAVGPSGTTTLSAPVQVTTVSAAGSFASQMTIPSTTNYGGGYFQMSVNTGTVDMTSLMLTKSGTLGDTYITNFGLYASSTCQTSGIPGDAIPYAGGSVSGGVVTLLNPSFPLSTTPTCFYVVFDVAAGATPGSTVGFVIANPSTDVGVVSGTATPATSVGPSTPLTNIVSGVTRPTVTTQAPSSVGATTATGNGNITATGGANADTQGFVYDTVSHVSDPGNVAPTSSGYASHAENSGSYTTGAYTVSLSTLSAGTTYYIRAYAHNSAGYTYGSEVSFLTLPAAPTSVAATDGTSSTQVTVTWVKSTGATNYHVWRDAVDLGLVGDVATYDDTGANAPVITPGTASASDGTFADHVALSVTGASIANGTTHTYKVVAVNATGLSADSTTNTGYRGAGSLSYQWRVSAADSDASYSDITGGATASYDYTSAPADGTGRYYKVNVSSTGSVTQTSTADRGYRSVANTAPTVALNTPGDASSSSNTTPALNFTGTDAESNAVEYNVQLASNNTFGSSAFISQSAGIHTWVGVAVNSVTGDVYATVDGGDIYKQSGGTGSFTALGAGNQRWQGIDVNPTNGDVYVALYSGDIYKQTGGVGSFVALNANTAGRSWSDVAVNPSNGDVYAVVYTGDIYKQTGGSGNFATIGSGSKGWTTIAVNPSNGDVYATVYNGDIWKQTAGSGAFAALSAGTKVWYGITIDQRNGDVYASEYSVTGDIYKQTGGAGSFVAMGTGGKKWVNIAFNSANASLYGVVDGSDIFEQTNLISDKVSTTDAGFTAGHPFASGSAVNYTVQSALTAGTTYYWRVRAIDPTGSNTYGSWSSTRSFTVTSSVTVPTVTTQAPTSVGATTATGNGNITATGGVNADTRGFVYDTVSHASNPGNVAPTSSGYASHAEDAGSYSTGAYTKALSSLSTATTYYIRAYAHNSSGYAYGTEVSFLTLPAAPTNVAATDGTSSTKVTVTWTKSTGATNYHVWRDSTDLGLVGDIASYYDTGANPPTITPGTASASDGTYTDHVALSVTGASVANGTTHTYKVVAVNATGLSADSATDTGYLAPDGPLTYQWQVSAADSDASYSNITGGTTASYNYTSAPADGTGRYYKVVVSALGAANQNSTSDRGYRSVPNTAPTLSISQPDGVSDTVAVGSSYNITYTLSDPDNVVTAAFYYDTNNSGLDGTAITGACATAAEGTGVTCSWNTTGMTPGSYYIYGITNDGVNSAVSAYSSGTITINAAGALSSGVIANWSMEDGSGTSASDNAGSGNTQNFTGTIPWTTGKIGGALGFDGTQYSSASATNFNLTGAFTISVWVYPTTLTTNVLAGLVDKSGTSYASAYNLRINDGGVPNGQVQFNTGNGSERKLASNTNVTINNWWNIVGTYDPAVGMTLYINGAYDNSNSVTGTLLTTGYGLELGRNYSDNSRILKGKLDEVTMWNRALSASEVTTLYNAAAGLSYPFSNTIPTVTTQAPTSVGATTATGNGNITATGGVNADTRGFVYDTVSHASNPGNVAPTSSGYASHAEDAGSYSTGAYTKALSSLSTATTYYIRAYAHNSSGYAYGTEVSFLTLPAAPTNVAATDGTSSTKVTVTWTKSTGATNYHVWRDSTDLGLVGDVATYDDTGANAPTITPGTASASDGTFNDHVALSVTGASIANGTTHTYKVVAVNATGLSADSTTDTGYRVAGSLSYQWQVSAADSDASYSDISGGTTASYDYTGAPSDGTGRYYKVNVSSTGATTQASTSDRGYRSVANTAPTLSISQPDGVSDTATVGDLYNITYTLSDPDNVVTAAFYYDTNNSGLDGTAITGACATAAEGTGVTCSWNTTGMTPGSYYIYGITNDGVNSAVSAYSSGTITINASSAVHTSIIRQDCTGYTDCFTSLAAWQANSGNLGSKNLVSLGKQENVEIQGSWASPDSSVTISGWTTDSTRYIKIYTTGSARHSGVWSDTAYRMVTTGRNSVINIYDTGYIWIDGLELMHNGTQPDSMNGIAVGSGAGMVKISNNILVGGSSLACGADAYCAGISGANATSLIVWNNIIYGPWREGIYWRGGGTGLTEAFYNNTIINNVVGGIIVGGYPSLPLTVYVKNNLIQGSATNYTLNASGVTFNTATNISQDTSSPDSAYRGTTVSFLGASDYHITGAHAGTNLSADGIFSFTTDIDGSTRTGWDIGADEYTSGGLTVPTVTTQAASGVGSTTATGNGNITATGGANEDVRGFVYDTASHASNPGNVAPTSSGYASHAEDSGSYSTGAYTKALSSLSTGTTYYMRAYAHNSVGYAYGGEVSFATPAPDNGHYYIDFSTVVGSCGSGWTSIADSYRTDTTTQFTLVDSANTSTGKTLQFTTAFTGSSGNGNGTTSSTKYPSCATGDSIYISDNGGNGGSPTLAFQVQGLDNAKTYDFTFYASRTGVADVRTTTYTIGGTSVNLDAANNVDNVVVINGVSPSGGIISITVSMGPGNTGHYGYIGVMEVVEHTVGNIAPTANAGTDQAITLPAHSVTLTGSGTDSDGTIASYLWTETTSTGATIVSPTSATTQVTDLASGSATFRLTVTDNQGATGYDDVVVTTNTAAGVGNHVVKVVVLGSSTAAGTGASPSSNAWVNLYTSYLQGVNASNQVINLAVGGYTTYHILATGTTNPGNRPAVDTTKNITTALSYNPDAIIVNMPTNDAANGYADSETETNFTTLMSIASAAGVPIWIATTQPRNLDQTGRTSLINVRDWINANVTNPVDFWSVVANADGTINSAYDSGDGIHLNNAGHRKLYNRVAGSGMLETITTNTPPTVALNTPTDASSVPTTTPTLNFTGTDRWADTIEYNVQIDTANTFNSQAGSPLINKVSTTDAGFTAGHPFASGAAVNYTVQSALTLNNTYYWRVRAIDPTGSNTYGAWSSVRSFTVVSAITISGTLYDTSGSARLAADNLKIAVGATTSYTGAVSASNGTFSVPNIVKPSTGTIITIWLTGNTDKASMVFRYSSTNCNGSGSGSCSNLALRLNNVILDSFDGSNITSANLAACDNNAGSVCGSTPDTDIGFTSDMGASTYDVNLTYATNILRVNTGATFAPGGGSVTAQKLNVQGTFTGTTETLTLTGAGTSTTCGATDQIPLCVAGTFTAPSSVTYNTTVSTNITLLTYKNLTLAPIANTSATYTLGTGAGQTLVISSGTFTLGNGNYTIVVSAATNNPTMNISTGTSNFTVGSSATFIAGSGAINLTGNLNLPGGSTYTKGSGILTFKAGGVQTVSDGNNTKQDLGSVVVASNGTNTTLNMSSSIRVTNLTVNANQTLVTGSNTLTVTGSGSGGTRPMIVQSGGTFTNTGGTVEYVGTMATTVSDLTSDNITYNNLTIDPAATVTYDLGTASSQSLVINGNLIIGDGTNAVTVRQSTYDPTIFIKGDTTIRANAIYTKGNSILTMNKGGSQTFLDNTSSKQNLGNLKVSANGTNSSISCIDAKFTSITLDANQGFLCANVTITGNGTPLSIGSGASYTSSGTTSFISSATNGTTIPTNAIYKSITIGTSGNTFTVASGTLNVGGDLTITAGTLDLNANNVPTTVGGNMTNGGTLSLPGTITVGGNWTNNGNIIYNNGSVVFNTTTTSIISGGSFVNLAVITPGKAVQFKAGVTIGVSGTFSVKGDYGKNIIISSDTPSSQWTLNAPGTVLMSYVSVQDSACSAGTVSINLNEDSVNLGNNGPCWKFVTLIKRGGSGNSAYAPVENGSGGGTPTNGGTGQDGGTNPSESGSGGGTPTNGGTGQGGGGGGAAP